ncbi:hypothetical protein MLD38_008834 [Melastoma candidum]|uniref:Uncharacterized protein n=1 Tax=Melastoma candidum TaxID=119954 RepID=A0ACB9S463_9MYRT|nr:hypothetical protein MLD38_008834 [Melastoma candidum]
MKTKNSVRKQGSFLTRRIAYLDREPCQRKFDTSSPSKTITSPLSAYRSPSTHVNGTVGNSNGVRVAAATPDKMVTSGHQRDLV